jgi:predicted MFS family arabinose efflux permease
MAALFAEKATWRALFYMLCPTIALCGLVALKFLPNSKSPPGKFKENVKKIDYWGVTTASIALILILIPVSGGGAYFAWNS